MLSFFLKSKKTVNRSLLCIAADCLAHGGIIGLPTDTVPGLVANCRSIDALHKMYFAKNRSISKPCAVFAANIAAIKKFAFINSIEQRIMEKFLGKVTIVLELRPSSLHHCLSRWGNYIGVRIPDDILIHRILQVLQIPLFATSLNHAGMPPVYDLHHFSHNMKEYIDLYISYTNTQAYRNCIKPSTVLKILNDKIHIIREGIVSFDQICSIIAN